MKVLLLIPPICILLLTGTFVDAQVSGARLCDTSFAYEDHNMIDYTIKAQSVKGTVIDATNVSLPNTCIGLFNSDHSKLLRFVESDGDGKFNMNHVSPGKYWLVVKDLQRAFCPAATKLEVRRWRGKRELVVHMDLSGIDKCSFCEAK